MSKVVVFGGGIALGLSACYTGFEADDTLLATTSETSGGPGSGDPSSATTATATATPTTGGPDVTTSMGVTSNAADTATTLDDSGDATTEAFDPTSTGADTATSDGSTTNMPDTNGPDETTGGPDDTGDTNDSEGDEAAMVCARWQADRAQLGEGTWNGSVNGCNAGMVSQDGRANALRLINLYRFLAKLPPVTEDAGRTAKAQACALMMHANGSLSHSPPLNWQCYSADGAEAAGKSNIAGTAGVQGVDLYMVDPGNETTIGHRRWILSNSLGGVGLGSTSQYSCMWVIGGGGNAGKAWTAWPPPGVVPYQAIHVPEVGWTDTDKTGWTVQSDSINLGNATVTVTEDGIGKPVATNVLGANYGSSHAIRFVPQGWEVAVGKTYSVELGNVGQPISYEFTVIDCG